MRRDYRWIEWNVDHIWKHKISPIEAEFVIDNAKPPYPEFVGDNKWHMRGQTADGRYVQVIFVFDPDDTVFVIHARGMNDREKRQLRKRLR